MSSPKISVITPSIRPEGQKIVKRALLQQSFREYEWIVQGRDEPLREGEVWSLNRDYNKAIRKAKGELIVSFQDYTYCKPDTLQRFWDHHIREPKTLIGAVGNKYADDNWMVQTWQDPRERADQGTLYGCYFSDVEWNLCSVPREALYAVGGFDESLDMEGYGMDGYSVNDRINLIGGYDFKLDQSIKSYSLEHDRPKDWDEKNLLHKYKDIHARYLVNPKLPYLQ